MSDSTINVREQVQEAVGMEWPAFEARHPNLAGLLDQSAVIERATAHLADNPEYRRAMDEATAAGMTGQAAVEMVRSFVQDWMARLVF
ncbi:MAG TPA: hypothetical protein VH475_14185 [Tepidisphaeraceae bacterium]|jgi:signal transduction protein with GAF and PtsI domain